MRIVPVQLGKKTYNIYIGHNLENTITDFFQAQQYSQRALIITDTNIAPLYADKIKKILKTIGFDAKIAIIDAGEQSKSLATAEKLYTIAINHRLDRKSPIIALGGGVVGDLAGFIAATFMRGVPFIQMPTSLLAQVDSSVGGKVAVNHNLGKNLIGAFYQPQAVFMDLEMIKTLPVREISTGLGEVIKYGYIYDYEFYTYLIEHQQAILKLEPTVLTHIIARSCEIKADVVAQDECEAGLRAILNFGHTLAHAIEKETNYTLYNHGEAVAIGMIGAAKLSYKLGLIKQNIVDDMCVLLTAMNLPIKAKSCNAINIYKDIFHDKKTINGQVTWVLLEKIGKVCLCKDVPEKLVKETIQELL